MIVNKLRGFVPSCEICVWGDGASRLIIGSARRDSPALGLSIRVHLLAFAGCSQTAEDCRFYNSPTPHLKIPPCTLCPRWLIILIR